MRDMTARQRWTQTSQPERRRRGQDRPGDVIEQLARARSAVSDYTLGSVIAWIQMTLAQRRRAG